MRFYIEPTHAPGRVSWFVRNPAKDGPVVARAPETYATEKEARSAILKARKAFAGAKMATVEVLDAPLDH